MINYTIINSAVNAVIPLPKDMSILRTIHNAGFFSNSTIRLMDIVTYYNRNGRLPDEVDSSEQWMDYRSYNGERMDTYYFTEQNNIEGFGLVDSPYCTTDCMAFQFNDYKQLKFNQLKPFVDKYFTPSDIVTDILKGYQDKYNLYYKNLCAVFYRGNDKVREMSVSPYDVFINKAREIKEANPSIRFLVQPDETEFLQAFMAAFPDSIYFTETPSINKQNSAVFIETKQPERKEYGAKFFAALLALSKCHTLITHSGNCGLWATLYRGNSNNIHQVFENKWL